MVVVQVNTLQGPVDQPFGGIYYALWEIKAIDRLPQGHNKSRFPPKGVCLLWQQCYATISMLCNKVNQIRGKKLWNCLTSTKDTER